MNSKLVVKLREETGAGVMECKRALEKAGGDFEKAVEFIHEAGILKAESKKDRKTGAGLLYSYIHNERVGVLLEVRAETDFVVRSEPFKELAHNLAMQIAAMEPADVKELLKQPFIKDESLSIADVVKRVTAKVGENIKVEKFCRYEL
ncbi:MAG: translation elongation factor Ts [Minisyncoccia bacterium]|jgi:elongation factor Ts